MTTLPAMSAARRRASGGFWRRTWAMLIKEFIQLKRDRVSFAMIIMIPLVQLLLFGYAINTNPRHLPTAVLLQEQSDLGRSILKAIQNTAYFDVTHIVQDKTEFDHLLASGAVLFAIEIPANFERAVRRGDRPALLVAADATDPVAAGSAMAALGTLVQTALQHDRAVPDGAAPPFEIRTHARYNPAANTSFNIVPGLVGTILTMTMLIFTALSVTREIERGTMESLLAMPITPVEIMLGKIIPYIIVGFVQAALIIAIGIGLFGVPAWAQWIGEFLPLTHYLRIVRGIMLKGAAIADLRYDTLALAALMLIAMIIAITRFRRTLD
jgi:ABC-2 type transport system permease protein